jgi:Zn-dependent metalloprotease
LRRADFFLPPYILERLASSDDPDVRLSALAAIEVSSEARAARVLLSRIPAAVIRPSPRRKKYRLVYDMKGGAPFDLPGTLARSEGEPAVKDRGVNEAYSGTGKVHDFFRKVLNRNSLDDQGMTIVSSVHVGKNYNNAFWNGEQMAFGDGDGRLFRRFTRSIDVIGHELAHGVISHTANLEYRGESGALNEHFADVFGILISQWKRNVTARKDEWLVGREIMGPKVIARGLRTFKAEKAYENDPLLGTDPQPKHMKDLYRGASDRGGVHINSGIPNHAFYMAARALGGRAWERAGKIWYRALLRLEKRASISDCANAVVYSAAELYPRSRKVQKSVEEAWAKVGLKGAGKR